MVQSRLLDIAVREFGSKGLEGASTRGIATAAGTAMSSITYHYGGKDGLYRAAAKHIAQHMVAAMAPALACEAPPEDAEAARACIRQLVQQLATKLLADEDRDWSLFIMREQMNPTEAFDLLYAGPMGRMAERLVALLRTATGAPEPVARVTAVLLFGQALVWRAGRALAERVIGGPAPAALPDIVQCIAFNTDAILDRLSAEQQEPQ